MPNVSPKRTPNPIGLHERLEEEMAAIAHSAHRRVDRSADDGIHPVGEQP